MRKVLLTAMLLAVMLAGCKEVVPEVVSSMDVAAPTDERLSPGMFWHWQLSGEIDTSVEAELYDIDLFDALGSVIDQLHADGRIVICYFSAGSWEDWRPDAADFPEELIGLGLEGWTGENWLDIRRLDLLAPIMSARLDLAAAKGCDGVEPDNVDAYSNDSGFPLSYDDQLEYNIWLAEEAHARGLLILLKNDLDQVDDLLPFFDGAINEQCFQYEECERLLSFIDAGKPVFGVEYEIEPDKFCPQANVWGFSWMLKRWELDAWSQPCWQR